MSRQEAFEQLAPIAHRIVRRYKRKLPIHMRTDDLLNVALMGVWTAVNRYYAKGMQVMTAVAALRANGAVVDYLRTRDWATKYSRKIGNPVTMTYIEDYASKHSSVDYTEPNTGFMLTALKQLHTPEDEAAENQIARRRNAALEDALLLLDDRDRYVMRQLLKGVSQAEVATKLKVSAPRISQIVQRVTPRLRAHVSRVLRHRKL